MAEPRNEHTSKLKASDAAWLLRNKARIIRAIFGSAGSAMTQAPDRKSQKAKRPRK